jgi:hypothetical protein
MGGPGEPPPGFISSSTSAPEWIFYWAAAKVTGSPKDPRQPSPYGGFIGGDNWRYQKPYGDGKSSAIIDFVFYTDSGLIAVRIQTYQFHEHVNAFKQATDMLQYEYLGRFFKVVDVRENDLTQDKTGQSAIMAVKRVLSGQETLPPLKAGTSYNAR